ncbi:MAG: HlyD family efflux transporter periplasmic adaptor subunit [Candidatus Moranbacteria bacterium]|nr:HlyD family efflux transporter periplasmic adaptor subunit [Candidatus Moranbacteria bacterium]
MTKNHKDDNKKDSQEKIFPKSQEKIKSISKFKYLLIILVFFIGFIVLSLIGKHKAPEQEDEIFAKKVKTVTIGGEQTKKAVLEKSIKVASEDETRVFAEYSGRIIEENFEVGDKVKKGQILAKFSQNKSDNITIIDLEKARENLAIAEENLDDVEESTEKNYKVAKNNVELAKIALDEAETSGDENDIKTAEEKLEKAERSRDAAEALGDQEIARAEQALLESQKGLEKARAGYSKTIVRAPIDGLVIQKSINKNSYLNQGEQIASIGNLDNLFSRLELSREEIRGIQPGSGLEIQCLNNNGSIFSTVTDISPIAKSDNLRYELKIKHPKDASNNCIAVNQFVTAKLEIPNYDYNNYFLPITAVKLGQQRNIVYVIEDNTAKVREVKIGKVFGNYVEITEGLEANEIVALKGSRNLKDQDPVEMEN